MHEGIWRFTGKLIVNYFSYFLFGYTMGVKFSGNFPVVANPRLFMHMELFEDSAGENQIASKTF